MKKLEEAQRVMLRIKNVYQDRELNDYEVIDEIFKILMDGTYKESTELEKLWELVNVTDEELNEDGAAGYIVDDIHGVIEEWFALTSESKTA